MFMLSEYVAYLESNMKHSYFSNPNSKYTKENFINSLVNFSASGHGSELGARPGSQIKSLFPEIAANKPVSVSYTHWFLFNYGYKYCPRCDAVARVTEFSYNNSTWCKLTSMCKSCDNERCAVYKHNNKDKAKAAYDIWYSNNKHIRAAASAKRRAAVKQAIPKWLTEEQIKQITEMYKTASKAGMQVDHIVPLQHKTVCGLHVPWNLQILSAIDNRHKNNKYNDW